MISAIRSKIAPESPVAKLVESWPDNMLPPVFKGPNQDLTIDKWLTAVAATCAKRKVPKEQWPEVARHFMSGKARRRIKDLEAVMESAYGQPWSWKWSSFMVALRNLGWHIDAKKTQDVEVQEKAPGRWSFIKRGGERGNRDRVEEQSLDLGFLARATQMATFRSTAASNVVQVATNKVAKDTKPTMTKAAKDTKATTAKSVKDTKTIVKASGITKALKTTSAATQKDPSAASQAFTRMVQGLHLAPAPADPPPVIAQVPIWLLNASEALFAVINEPLTVTSVLAAVLITVGSIPAIPAVSAGPTVQVAGYLAVAVGTRMRNQPKITEAGKKDKKAK
ncbi:predicted protein [Postia placenta Mad-698-R]|uniref:Uncharacterized protein n=1 Tax=Postia placenta MAD-698-R-SB12 TaxID=670580 RepID=A0A1X6MKX7_9APHY|nr:hypothetical protein POSPLADRAFT_1050368 [Postia placenta MAD-698-R-SB12]EED79018.1 predicted protein [Postia placenta Mad-698-R]OSX56968.1 hypothetical protein POSPLADRAFT_1050368 [Postia placenta MAD-698-R-SB12]